MTFDATEKKFAAQKKIDWELIEAIASDAAREGMALTSAAAIAAAGEASARAGNERALDTVRGLCTVAKFDTESTVKQRGVWRRYGWSVINELARSRWSQEAAYEFLIGEHKTRRQVREAIKTSDVAGDIGKSSDPELWDDDQWEAFDADVVNASRIMLMAFNLRHRGLYEPSVEATAQLALLREPDLDAELAALTGDAR